MISVKTRYWLMFCLCLTALLTPAAEKTNLEKEDPSDAKEKKEAQAFLDKLKWTKGPAKAPLKDIAQVDIPEGFKIADADSTRKLLSAMGNPTSGTELGLLAPESMDWMVLFRFSDTGYVKDDDKDKLDADALLKSIKEGTEAANEERKKMGAPPLKIIGWDTPPRYNDKTHNLEWAIRGESEGHAIINYNTRVLGRKGVMEIKLLTDPEKLALTMPTYQKILAGYSYKSGETYAEYKSGDKVAQYGLAALVVGGAAVGAAKLGLFAWLAVALKKFGKFVILGFAAVAAWIKKLFTGRGKDDASSS